MSLESSTVRRGRFTQSANTERSQPVQSDVVTLLVSAAPGVTSPEPLSTSSSSSVLWHLLCLQSGLGLGPSLQHGLCCSQALLLQDDSCLCPHTAGRPDGACCRTGVGGRMPRDGCHSKWVGVVVMLKTGEVLGVERGNDAACAEGIG